MEFLHNFHIYYLFIYTIYCLYQQFFILYIVQNQNILESRQGLFSFISEVSLFYKQNICSGISSIFLNPYIAGPFCVKLNVKNWFKLNLSKILKQRNKKL